MRHWAVDLLVSLAAVTALLSLASGEPSGPKGRLLIPVKYEKVTTHTVFAVQTTTTFPYCVAGAYNSNICARRRRRRKRDSQAIADIAEESNPNAAQVELDSSLHEARAVAEPSRREGKIYTMTVWKTTSMTTSITVLYTDRATTLSLSLICIPAGGSLPPSC